MEYHGLDWVWHDTHQRQFRDLAPDIADHLVFLHENHARPDLGVGHMAQVIQSARADTGLFPVVCLDTNPWAAPDLAQDLLAITGPGSWFMLSHDALDAGDQHRAHWPFYLVLQASLDPDTRPHTRRIGMLSGAPRRHRLEAWHRARPWIQAQDVVVINAFRKHAQWDDYHDPEGQRLWNETQDLLPWSTDPIWIDGTDPGSDHGLNHMTVEHEAYRACVNIALETDTSDHTLFVTEKTWKSLRAGCLTVTVGSPHLPAWMASLGFEVLPWLDPSQAWPAKIDHVAQLFQRQDIWDLYHDHRYVCQHNQALLSDPSWLATLLRPALDRVRACIS